MARTNRNSIRTITLAGAMITLAGSAGASPDLPGGWSVLLDDVRRANNAGQFDGIDIIDRPGNRDITGDGTVNRADIAGFFDSIGSHGQRGSVSGGAQSYGDVVRFLAAYAIPERSDPFPPPGTTQRSSATNDGLRKLADDIHRLHRPGDVNVDGTFDFYDTLEFFSAFESRSSAADMNLDDITDYQDVIEFAALLQSATSHGNANRVDGGQQLTDRPAPQPGPDPQPFPSRQISSGGSATSNGNANNVGDAGRRDVALPADPGPDPQPFPSRQISSGGSATSNGNATNVGDAGQWDGTLPADPGPDPQPFPSRQISSGGSATSNGNANNVGDAGQWDGTLPADMNADGALDIDDVREFFRRFISNHGTADFNADGGWTFEDVQDFMDLFNTMLP